jgi:hypothetical protein
MSAAFAAPRDTAAMNVAVGVMNDFIGSIITAFVTPPLWLRRVCNPRRMPKLLPLSRLMPR